MLYITDREIEAHRKAVEASIPHAEESLIGDLDELGNWLAWQAGAPRAMSAYFGDISAQELVLMAMNPAATAEQVKAAMQELRRRFLAEHQNGVQLRAEAMA